MKPQTEDNIRCLAAVGTIIGVLIGFGIKAPGWFKGFPEWSFGVLFMILLLAVFHIFNYRWRGSVDVGRVSFDEDEITHTLPDGDIETLRWTDLKEVKIVTTDEGPWAEDAYWILLGTERGCAISNGAEGAKELLVRLQQLYGFDNETFIKAMGSTSNEKFVCWRRQD
jgi:hypothetical protein